MILPSDIRARIEHDFSDPKERRFVTQLLLNLEVPEKDRVSRCILFVANGDLDNFRKMESLAKTDYRDAIMAGEYEYPTDRRLRNLGEPFNT